MCSSPSWVQVREHTELVWFSVWIGVLGPDVWFAIEGG